MDCVFMAPKGFMYLENIEPLAYILYDTPEELNLYTNWSQPVYVYLQWISMLNE